MVMGYPIKNCFKINYLELVYTNQFEINFFPKTNMNFQNYTKGSNNHPKMTICSQNNTLIQVRKPRLRVSCEIRES